MTSPRNQAAMLALGIAVLFDVLRVFLPSLITLFGRAGSAPAELMGLYAAAWFALPFLSVLLKPRWALLGGAVALVLARLLLQAGVEQLYVASAGMTAGLVFLHGCARTLPRAAVPGGIMGGLALSTLAHLLLDGVDLIWRDGTLPWLAALTLCACLLTLVRVPPGNDPAPARVWFLFGPSLLLTGMAATSWAKAAVVPPRPHWGNPPEPRRKNPPEPRKRKAAGPRRMNPPGPRRGKAAGVLPGLCWALEVGGRELGIVNTHLQAPDGQAPEVAAIVRGLTAGKDAARARPTFTASDEPTRARPTSTTAEEPPHARPTSTADAPVERIDHVLISKGLTVISAQAPRIAYSDHLPVLTTLRLTSVDQEG